MEYGIQLYSLNDVVYTDIESALKSVSEAGYKVVELDGFSGKTAEEVKELLAKYSLKVNGAHVDFNDLKKDFDKTVADHKAVGNSRIIVPYANLSSREKLDDFIDFLNEYAPRLREHGMELGFHNHAAEFMATEEGFIPHEELQARTDVFFEIDTYWVYVAGRDPIEVIESLRDRVPVIHLKDGSRDGKGCSLGDGTAPVAAVKAKAEELGIDIVVESEGCNPNGDAEVKRCMAYLVTLDDRK